MATPSRAVGLSDGRGNLKLTVREKMPERRNGELGSAAEYDSHQRIPSRRRGARATHSLIVERMPCRGAACCVPTAITVAT
jgi:hypothetical protein